MALPGGADAHDADDAAEQSQSAEADSVLEPLTSEPTGLASPDDSRPAGPRDTERHGQGDPPSPSSLGCRCACGDGPIVITDATAFQDVLPQLLAAPALGFDIETTGLDPRSHRIRLAADRRARADGRVYVVDLFQGEAELLAPLLRFDGRPYPGGPQPEVRSAIPGQGPGCRSRMAVGSSTP